MEVHGRMISALSTFLLVVCAGCDVSLASDRATEDGSSTEAVPAVAHGPMAAINEFFAAAGARDWPAVEALLADNFKFYSDGALVLDRAGFMLAMKEDDMVIDSLVLSELETVLSDDSSLALVRYSLDLKSSVNGSRHDVRTVETVVLRRATNNPTRWQFVQNHASLTAT